MSPHPKRSTAWIVVALLVTGCGAEQTASSSTTTIAATTDPVQASSTTTTQTATTSTTDNTIVVTGEPDDLLVVGDWGSGTMPQGAVAGAMMRYAEENEIAAILTTGDNLYSDDADFLMQPYGWAEEMNVPFWLTWGNHDVETETRVEIVNETFGDPPRWTTRQWGAVEIVIVDSTQLGSEEQTDFLTETLAAGDDPTIVVFHHPPYSCGSHGDAERIQDNWLPLFDDDVFLVLNGHEHNYQRFQADGVAYVVTGGGGASLTELGSCPVDHVERIDGQSIHHFVVLEQGEGLAVSAVDVNGEVFDQFELTVP